MEKLKYLVLLILIPFLSVAQDYHSNNLNTGLDTSKVVFQYITDKGDIINSRGYIVESWEEKIVEDFPSNNNLVYRTKKEKMYTIVYFYDEQYNERFKLEKIFHWEFFKWLK